MNAPQLRQALAKALAREERKGTKKWEKWEVLTLVDAIIVTDNDEEAPLYTLEEQRRLREKKA